MKLLFSDVVFCKNYLPQDVGGAAIDTLSAYCSLYTYGHWVDCFFDLLDLLAVPFLYHFALVENIFNYYMEMNLNKTL